jgi:hypothetical protein
MHPSTAYQRLVDGLARPSHPSVSTSIRMRCPRFLRAGVPASLVGMWALFALLSASPAEAAGIHAASVESAHVVQFFVRAEAPGNGC